jgi:hypothetical protein
MKGFGQVVSVYISAPGNRKNGIKKGDFHLFKIFSSLKMKELKISSHSGTPDEF